MLLMLLLLFSVDCINLKNTYLLILTSKHIWDNKILLYGFTHIPSILCTMHIIHLCLCSYRNSSSSVSENTKVFYSLNIFNCFLTLHNFLCFVRSLKFLSKSFLLRKKIFFSWILILKLFHNLQICKFSCQNKKGFPATVTNKKKKEVF